MQPNLTLATSLALALASCGGAKVETAVASSDPAVAPSAAPAAQLATRRGLLTQREAERYALELVNKDRRAFGLPPVVWDETAAVAGRKHARDMAKNGYTAHWGTAGDVPEERYTEAGGADFVMENAGCYGDSKPRALDDAPRIDPHGVERIEQAFMNETPPHDGHRKNILAKWHTSVGVGIAQAKDVDVPCVAQEFVDDWGDYEPLPKKAKVGAKVHVAGLVHGAPVVAGVAVARIDKDAKRSPEDLNTTHSYAIPQPYVSYFPHGFVTPIEVAVDPSKKRFSIDVPLSDGGKPGVYEVSVWGIYPGSKDLVMLSLRTIEVD